MPGPLGASSLSDLVFLSTRLLTICCRASARLPEGFLASLSAVFWGVTCMQIQEVG